MTNAEHQARYRAKHGKEADPTNAARQRRWRERRAGKQMAKRAAPEVTPEAPDPLLTQAVAILEGRGETDLIGRLRASWPYMNVAVRQQMAAGKGFRFWLRD
jgi:hypothetical protein